MNDVQHLWTNILLSCIVGMVFMICTMTTAIYLLLANGVSP